MKKVLITVMLAAISITAIALRVESGDTSAKGTFYAVKASDYITPSTGLSDANFLKWYWINGTYGSAKYITITEINAVNMPGLYQVTYADPNIITLTNCSEAELVLRFFPNDGVTAPTILAAEVFKRDKAGYKLAADGLDALDVNEPASTDPNTWSFRHAVLWPFWLKTNVYVMEIPDANYPGSGTLTLYKRDGITPLAIQDINETSKIQSRYSIWK